MAHEPRFVLRIVGAPRQNDPMASTSARRPENVDGDFFVDETCIDCDTCRWMAPAVFDRANGKARVHSQPVGEEAAREAARALIACPTSSIGCADAAAVRAAAREFPVPLVPEPDVAHCGYHSESSFGAASYFLRREGGNVLVDSPRFSTQLARRIEESGGLRWMWLSHRDDVADHARWAERFPGLRRVLMRADHRSSMGELEVLLESDDPVELEPGLLVVPVPGHTRGSACLLHEGVLFTGDHLAYSESVGHLYAFRRACWYDWEVQRVSMARLLDLEFEWVLPGHGRRRHLPAHEMRAELERCIDWMGR